MPIEVIRILDDGTVLGLNEANELVTGTKRQIGYDEVVCETIVNEDQTEVIRSYTIPDGTVRGYETTRKDGFIANQLGRYLGEGKDQELAQSIAEADWAANLEHIPPQKVYIEMLDADRNLTVAEKKIDIVDWSV